MLTTRKTQLKILLVDDDEDDAFIIRDMLSQVERFEFSVEWAPTYEAGMDLLTQNSINAVLVDYDLGARNGLEFIRQAISIGVGAPLVMVTGRGRYEIDRQAMEAGAADYLSKSDINPSYLERTIRFAIERRRVQEELERRVQERTQALQRTTDILESIFSNVHMLLAYLDRDFNFIRVNQRYAETDGHPAEFYVGKNHFALFPSQENEAIFRRVIETGTAFNALSRPFTYADHPERGVTYWDWSLQPVRDAHNAVSGLILTLVEVTEQKRIQTSLQTNIALFEGLFEAAPEAILLILDDGSIQRVNHLAEKLFGYSPQELVGSPVEMLIPERFRAAHILHRSHYYTDPKTRPMGQGLNLTVQHKEGHEIPVDITLSPLSVNDRVYTICIILDLRRKRGPY